MTGHEAAGTADHSPGPGRPDPAPSDLPRGTPTSLSVTGVSRDGAALLLVDGTGAPFLLDITPRLRAAVRGDASRTGKVDTTMDSTLRPRDIQARIRAGESAEAVAEAAQTSVDKIMAFAGPVLAEREHVAERAQRSNLRRPAGESAGSSRTLGDAVAAHLRSCNVDPDVVTWDAWRREDGRWTLHADYELPVRSGSAHLTFDTRGNYVVLDDDDARWLVGESVPGPASAHDDLQDVRERRLAAVPAEELPLGVDAIELVQEEPPSTEPVRGQSHEQPPEQADGRSDEQSEEPALPLEAFFDTPPPEVGTPPAAEAEPVPETPRGAAPEGEEPAPRRPVQKKKGRASVPSWDEIMFGGPNEQ